MTRPEERPGTTECAGFDNTREHLRAELAWIELLLKREMLASMGEGGKLRPVDEFAGMYVSEEEMRRYLGGADSRGDSDTPDALVRRLDERIHAERLDIDRRASASAAAGIELRLRRLASRFGLSDVETRILLFCIAPDADVRFHRCLAYLQNDVSRKRPSVQFLARVCDGIRDVPEVRALLGPDAPLVNSRLVTLPRQLGGHDIPVPIQQPVVRPAVIDFLFGHDRVAEELAGFAELVDPRPLGSLGSYGRHHSDVLDRLIRLAQADGTLPLSYIAAPEGAQRARLVEQIALDTGWRVLRVRAKGLLSSGDRAAECLALMKRDAMLHGALLHIEDIDEMAKEESRSSSERAALQMWLSGKSSLPIVMTGTRSPAELLQALGTTFSAFEIPHPSIEERSEIWSSQLRDLRGDGAERVIDELASKFKFTPGQIYSAVRAATVHARGTAGDGPAVGIDDLCRCCREVSNQRLLAYARKIVPVYGWDDIALPAETRNQLHEICASVRFRRTVYGQWGFESKFSVGRGVNILFAGPSGTGKTMSAEIIAADLALDLYKIDLSCVVSKYVGETEGNLEKIFTEAESSNSILFFDEADALFGKRSETKDAHDRYANIEINYLLQKMDDYEGVVILATNLRGNMDAAFTRRLTHVVEFPAPDEELRQQIWSRVFPDGVPLAPDVDFEFLSRKFDFTGGSIKNIAVNSAFLAAQAGESVSMAHVIRATKREFRKLGKLCSKSEFGPYLSLVRNESED